ncbi:hypothetical protein DSO57_1031259 [Entomophthora muscae]|uniref:Uncharacterized protein n=1 Tax=Entomophthora muscae TaxID=34485 RepID=A0ACC2TBU6_9FUNG|nr:hypothetical protein DSO57_1031259 [Entomophthora muscae]
MGATQIPVDFTGSLRDEILNDVQSLCLNDSPESGAEERPSKPSSALASSWLDTDQYIFLERFHSALSVDLLEKFQTVTSDAEAKWFANHILAQRRDTESINFSSIKNLSQVRIKNRRFNYITQVLDGEGYFSENAIQIREPELFSTIFGKLKDHAPFGADVSLIDRMYYDIDLSNAQQRLQTYKDVEDDAFEEEEEDEEEEKEDQSVSSNEGENDSGSESDALEELIRLAKEIFLDGNDSTFDYSLVDHNELYDDIAAVNQEMQERYFDSDDHELPDPSGTGILDF